MRVRDFECRSHEAALELLGCRDSRLVTNSTYLKAGLGGNLHLFLHNHKIVLFAKDHTQLWARGFRTRTTKDRINRCLPPGVRLFQDTKEWYLHVVGDDSTSRLAGVFAQEGSNAGSSTSKVVNFFEGMKVSTLVREVV